ncbi:hypothetical protein [Methylobacterium frigidaeris]|uniref:Uncharacterized protein n=1 Tax=Methylobacterium frigidaeris TaxID=2038277 RepID=A0AA37HGH9_9HYPH|nr:hypothetical protein [Methylobacterium frigidaeris]GJD65134.1 hypothetical protein MPEAHAMD_5321 [Methylobacterium frigidaeris]
MSEAIEWKVHLPEVAKILASHGYHVAAQRVRDALAEMTRLMAERDEADRRAGAAEREMASLKEEARKRRWWLDDAKRSRGYSMNTSFDVVWAETCAKADEADRLREALQAMLDFPGGMYAPALEAKARAALNPAEGADA